MVTLDKMTISDSCSWHQNRSIVFISAVWTRCEVSHKSWTSQKWSPWTRWLFLIRAAGTKIVRVSSVRLFGRDVRYHIRAERARNGHPGQDDYFWFVQLAPKSFDCLSFRLFGRDVRYHIRAERARNGHPGQDDYFWFVQLAPKSFDCIHFACLDAMWGIVVFFLALKISSHSKKKMDSQNFLFLAPKLEIWKISSKFLKINLFRGFEDFFLKISKKWNLKNFLKIFRKSPISGVRRLFFLNLQKTKISSKFPLFGTFSRKFPLFFCFFCCKKKTIMWGIT